MTRAGAFTAFAAALAAGAGAAFYVPALAATRGDWPAPLDDVFIHYDFARSAAELHPFEWIAGQGFSSGETSPLYALLLAVGYALGFRGLALGAWAAILACASLVVLMRSLRELVAPAPAWVSLLGAATLVGVGALDWTWFSGMEGAVFCGAMGVALVRARRAREAAPGARRRAQRSAGAWLAVLVLLRPEAVLLVLLVSVAIARRALSQSARGALARTAGPAAITSVILLALNLRGTGDAASAGAVAKLLVYRPFLSDVDRASAFLANLIHAGLFFEGQLGRGGPAALAWPTLAVVALFARRTRALAGVCVTGAIGWCLLVSANDAARFQNFRYFAPAVALVLLGSALGVAALARTRAGPLGFALSALGLLAAARGVPAQIELFEGASGNIHDQQVEVGHRLAARMAPDESVLVGDAGAIVYVSGRHGVDALGLGGYGGLPFARAALAGQGSIVELIERIPAARRPRLLALYPEWFGDITRLFGREVDRVTLEKNFVCGALSKVIYEADWLALQDGDRDEGPDGGAAVVDVLDVGDVVSEAEHAYAAPLPRGGWTSLDVRTDGLGRRRFDAGRILPEGLAERFTLLQGVEGPASIVVRTDEEACDVEVSVARSGRVLGGAPLARDTRASRLAWAAARAPLPRDLAPGDVVTLRAARGTFRDYHVWIVPGA